jgi:hypothetical protein
MAERVGLFAFKFFKSLINMFISSLSKRDISFFFSGLFCVFMLCEFRSLCKIICVFC